MRTTGHVSATSVNLRDGKNGNILDVLLLGTKIEVLDDSLDGWPLVLAGSGGTAEVGYIDADNIAWDQTSDPGPRPGGNGPSSSNNQLSFIGKAHASHNARFMMITGELSVPDRTNGSRVYKVNTGGYGSSYRFKDGPTPPGTYSVIGPFPPDPRGMTRGPVGFKFILLPRTLQVPGGDLRGDFCIHPDGPPPGTLGCLGISEDGTVLEECRTLIAGLVSSNSSLKLTVDYEPGVLF